MADDFSVTVRNDGPVVVVAPTGEIDLLTAGHLRDALDSLDADVTVDLSEVTFMDCSGIDVLVAAHARASTTGRRVQVSGAHGITRRVIAALDLEAILIDRWVSPDGTDG